jgi:glucose uptake protein GlcU
MFAVQYTPVKSYEVHDGITFQWFVSSGSLFATILITAASGDLSMDCSGEGWMPFIGGMMFGLSNYLCVPLIQLLGMGKGFSLCNFVNIMTGYILGRIGFLGIPASGGHIGDVGCGIIGFSFILLANVEGDGERDADDADIDVAASPPPVVLEDSLVPEVNDKYRQQYREWRLSKTGSFDCVTAELLETIEAFNPVPLKNSHGSAPLFRAPSFCAATPQQGRSRAQSMCSSYTGFSRQHSKDSMASSRSASATGMAEVYRASAGRGMTLSASAPTMHGFAPISIPLMDPDPAQDPEEGQSASAKSSFSRDCVKTTTGILLALVCGMLNGSCATPGIRYNLDHPGSPFAAVLSMILGFWFMATVIYVVYTTGARIRGIRVPHAPIRPSITAGALWATGNALNLFNPTQLAFTIAYAVAVVGCLIIAGLISLCYYKEITGKSNIQMFCAALFCQLIGVVLICNAA